VNSSFTSHCPATDAVSPTGAAGGVVFGGLDNTAYKRSPTTFSSPGIIWYGVTDTELGPPPESTIRGSVSSRIFATSVPEIPSFAASQETLRFGVRFERSADG
jgi:hypothetical protein